LENLKYLNIGCGHKYHKDWINIDLARSSPDVIAADVLKEIPFPDNYFDVVYHSQVLEHIAKEKAVAFTLECYRVLKPGGMLRVVVPDLENIMDEYKKLLTQNLDNPNEISEANYDWILLELYDQTVRNKKGGQMAEFLKQPNLVNEKYVIDRMGYLGRSIRKNHLNGSTYGSNFHRAFSSWFLFNKAVWHVFRKIRHALSSETAKIGAFRLGGEIHMWMYDRYSLSRLLKTCGFGEISVKNPYESTIPGWNKYELDVKEGIACDPTSLFVEARKVLKTPEPA
jgi:predicted SAM-dependent methyltransferase